MGLEEEARGGNAWIVCALACALLASSPVVQADTNEILSSYEFDESAPLPMTIIVPRPANPDAAESAIIRVDSRSLADERRREEPPPMEFPWDQLLDGQKRYVIEFLDEFIAFVRDFGEQSDHHTTGRQFRSLFLHEISERMPGFAWALVVYSTHANVGAVEIAREGGGLGIQIPLIGSRKLFLDPNTGALVLRVLPIAGNLERVIDHSDPSESVESPGNGIRFRPTAEIEWRYRLWGSFSVFEPGFRALIQPNVLDPEDFRVVGEVFLGIRFPIERGIFQGVRFTPRCSFDLSSVDQELVRPERYGRESGGALQVAGRWVSCSVNASVEFGN